MTSGKYFNKGVKTFDNPNIGVVVRETPDKIVIFGEKNERYDVPYTEIQQVGGNVLLGLKSDGTTKICSSQEILLCLQAGKNPWEEHPATHIDFAHL